MLRKIGWLFVTIGLVVGYTSRIQAQKTGSAEEGTLVFNPRKLMEPRPAIVDAPFLKAADVADEVADNELVIGVVVNGQARAYPVNQLTGPRREIINDRLGRRDIAATW